jgi:hypothetical protein
MGSTFPYLQDVDVSIAEVNVKNLGERDPRTQHGCLNKKTERKGQVCSVWLRGVSLATSHQHSQQA